MKKDINFNDFMALHFVLSFMSVKELLVAAMHYFNEQENVSSKDCADTLFKAITSFLEE